MNVFFAGMIEVVIRAVVCISKAINQGGVWAWVVALAVVGTIFYLLFGRK